MIVTNSDISVSLKVSSNVLTNDNNRIYDKKVNNISEWNLLHDIFIPYDFTKHIDIHYLPIVRGCVNTLRGKAIFNHFQILFDIGCS